MVFSSGDRNTKFNDFFSRLQDALLYCSMIAVSRDSLATVALPNCRQNLDKTTFV